MTRSRLFALAAAFAATGALAACQSEAPTLSRVQPTFYQDLATPGAPVDAQKALGMINEYRLRNGSPALRLDPELTRIAASYARTMAEADNMSHQVTPETKIGPRLRAEGYDFAAAGENIAAGYRTLAEAFSGWRESQRHDRGMKDPEMTAMGIAIAQNPRSKYKVFWCLIFARPKGEVPGVAGMPGVSGVPSVVTVAGAAVPQ